MFSGCRVPPDSKDNDQEAFDNSNQRLLHQPVKILG